MPDHSLIATSNHALATHRPLAESPAAVYLARLGSITSRKTMLACLNTIAGLATNNRCDARTYPWHELRYQHTQALRAQLAERYAPATANKHLAALRGVLQEAWRLGQMEAEEYHKARDLKVIKAQTLPKGRALAKREIEALFAACAADTTPAGLRDAALVAILFGAGLRRSEVVALDIIDYDDESGQVTVRAGKGKKDRITYLGSRYTPHLDRWLRMRGIQPGALLCPVLWNGKLTLQRMTAQAVLLILRKRAKEAGVASFSPHDARRTMISRLLDAGADIETVRKLAGHQSVTTTSRYDRRGEDAKRKAADLL